MSSVDVLLRRKLSMQISTGGNPDHNLSGAAQPVLLEIAERLKIAMKEVQSSREQLPLDVAHTHSQCVLSAGSVAQQVRAFYFLTSMGSPPESQIAACAADLEKATLVYVSWAKGLLGCASLPARKLLSAPCAAVVKCVVLLLTKASGRALDAPDAAMVDSAAEKLKSLELSGVAAARRLLGESEQLIRDASEELHEAADEAAAAATEGGSGEESEEEGEEEGDADGESDLLGQLEVSAPVLRLVDAARELVALSGGRGVNGCGERDKVLFMMVTCAQAASEQIDSLACAAHEGDFDSLCSYGQSVGKVVGKLRLLLARECGFGEEQALNDIATRVDACAKEFVALAAKRWS